MGRKIRSGLKTVMTFSRIRKNFAPSDTSLIFDCPSRAPTAIGSKRTLYPAFTNDSVVVVGVENPFGRRCRNSRRPLVRAARSPDVRSGIGRPVR